MTLKERIKQLADEHGMSLPTLESELGFGNSTIVKWDKSTPNADKLNTVAKYFNVSMDYLLNGSEINSYSETENLKIVKYYTQLNDFGKREATKRVEELTYFPQYTAVDQELNAAHQRTDIDIPDNIDTSDDDIMDDENF